MARPHASRSAATRPLGARATAPCCCSASAPRCAAPSWSRSPSATCEPVPGRGLRMLVRRSKTDQHGEGQEIAVWANPAEPGFCPVAALDAWLAHRRTAPDLDWTATPTSRRAPAVLRRHQGRPADRRRAVRQGGRPPGQAGRAGRRPRPRTLLRPLAARRPRHRRRRRRRRPRRADAPDPPQIHRGRPRLPPPRRPLAQQRHRAGVPVGRARRRMIPAFAGPLARRTIQGPQSHDPGAGVARSRRHIRTRRGRTWIQSHDPGTVTADIEAVEDVIMGQVRERPPNAPTIRQVPNDDCNVVVTVRAGPPARPGSRTGSAFRRQEGRAQRCACNPGARPPPDAAGSSSTVLTVEPAVLVHDRRILPHRRSFCRTLRAPPSRQPLNLVGSVCRPGVRSRDDFGHLAEPTLPPGPTDWSDNWTRCNMLALRTRRDREVSLAVTSRAVFDRKFRIETGQLSNFGRCCPGK